MVLHEPVDHIILKTCRWGRGGDEVRSRSSQDWLEVAFKSVEVKVALVILASFRGPLDEWTNFDILESCYIVIVGDY